MKRLEGRHIFILIALLFAGALFWFFREADDAPEPSSGPPGRRGFKVYSSPERGHFPVSPHPPDHHLKDGGSAPDVPSQIGHRLQEVKKRFTERERERAEFLYNSKRSERESSACVRIRKPGGEAAAAMRREVEEIRHFISKARVPAEPYRNRLEELLDFIHWSKKLESGGEYK